MLVITGAEMVVMRSNMDAMRRQATPSLRVSVSTYMVTTLRRHGKIIPVAWNGTSHCGWWNRALEGAELFVDVDESTEDESSGCMKKSCVRSWGGVVR